MYLIFWVFYSLFKKFLMILVFEKKNKLDKQRPNTHDTFIHKYGL